MKKAILLALFLMLQASGAQAATTILFGTPVLLASGDLLLNGQQIELWGIERLMPNQQCWRLADNRPWDCGAQAATTLMQYMANAPVRCIVLSSYNGIVDAQCFRRESGVGEDDLARFLVAEGWARDRPDVSGGLYASEEDNARRNGFGIWTSRFQTAVDWQNGVARYVPYEPIIDAPPVIVQNPTVIYSTYGSAGVLILRPNRDHHDARHDDHHDVHNDVRNDTHNDGHHDDHRGDHRNGNNAAVTTTPSTPLSFKPAQQLNSQSPAVQLNSQQPAPKAAVTVHTEGQHEDHGNHGNHSGHGDHGDHDMDRDER